MQTQTTVLPIKLPKHPAKYTDSFLPVFAEMLQGAKRILDPMAGTGKIFQLEKWLPDADFQAVEIEEEWCAYHPKTTLGNALQLPWPDNYFDAICNSPTYGCRLADHYIPKDNSKRDFYRYHLGRDLHPDNSGKMQWGPKYQDFHIKAWTEARRVLCPGGRFVLNCKNHPRARQRQLVTEWHIETLGTLGFTTLEHRHIPVTGIGFGARKENQDKYESIVLFRLEAK